MSSSVTVKQGLPIDFGNVAVGATGTATVTLQNGGTSAVTINSISDPAQTIFKVTPPSLPATINAEASLDIPLSFTPKNTGNKTSSFTVTYSDGSKTVVNLQGLAVVGEGVAPNAAASKFELYPNPASTMLDVQGLTSPATYEIADVLGRTVAIGSVSATQHIDISNLLPGRYNVTVKSGGVTESHAVIVTK